MKKLVVIHVVEDISEMSGGVPAVVRQLSVRLSSHDVEVVIVHALGEPGILPSNIQIFKQKPGRLGSAWSFNIGLASKLQEIICGRIKERVVLHIHGVWSAPQYLAARIAYKHRIPFIFTAHGMLDPWLWHSQGRLVALKKRVYWGGLASGILSKANVVHAITKIEHNHLNKLLPDRRFEIIPNAIELRTDGRHRSWDVRREKVILFLGRIEAKKGVDILLRAFAESRIGKDWKIVVLGPFWSNRYRKELESLISENNMQDQVSFLGPTVGDEKIQWLRRAWVMVVPSHSEAIGLVNLEAAAYHLPTITTFQTGLFNWEEGGGLLTQPEVYSVRTALETACSWSSEERDRRGSLSHILVRNGYSWDAVLPRWISLYESVLI